MSIINWKLNKLEYFEAPGLSALVFHNSYSEGKQGGIEIIQHGERVATNGGLRLEPTPGQWSPLPEAGERQVDKQRGEVSVPLRYSELDLGCVVRVRADGASLRIAVDLARPIPSEWVGRVSFNLELFPGAYFGKSFYLGDRFGVFPRQANGPMIRGEEDRLQPVPLATGARLAVASEDPLRKLLIEQESGDLSLFDGRDTAHNGWFVVRSVVPTGATRDAIVWTLTPGCDPNWRRDPVICISQVGYHPDQQKRAIIELDARVEKLDGAILQHITPDGESRTVLSAQPVEWGRFLRYNYAIFDFTKVREPGMYLVRYGDQTTPPFKIGRDVYQHNVWQPALEVFLPVQMCHVEVREGSRVWHGACHLDDALQAPTSHKHFDFYQQGPETDTPFTPQEHIPGLDRGGWHDAGDYDLAAGSQAMTTFVLALVRETFGMDSDQTTVRPDEQLVLLHTPDGIPDIIHQVVHGVECLLSGYRAVGHSFAGIIAGSLEQYAHMGDAATMTDNLVYDPSLKPGEVKDGRSGKMDDRWAFTGRDTGLEYQVATALAAASRVLRGYRDALADECLETAARVWEYEQTHDPVQQPSAYVPREYQAQEILATAELLITTGEAKYRRRLLALGPAVEEHIRWAGWGVVRALDLIEDGTFTSSVRQAFERLRVDHDSDVSKNPFGLPLHFGIWGSTWGVQHYAVAQYYLLQAFPDLLDRENVLRALNYVLGCHPGSDLSLVSGVGPRSVLSAYGVNRADWSYIPGGGVSGPNLIKPDFPELQQPFPFLWQQSEYVIGGAATYIFCVLAADCLLNG
ncbi:MAG: glycoside hydrolase family 9 protein [Anaerolineae bacterium]|nr:glycoside hydrolase family 9 protein [Anaerolineae bacterium]